jgi:hypothetical protein
MARQLLKILPDIFRALPDNEAPAILTGHPTMGTKPELFTGKATAFDFATLIVPQAAV